MKHTGTLLCQCDVCADRRLDYHLDKMKEFRKEAGNPSSPDQTVMVHSFTVRSHWRRQPNHLNGDEALRVRLRAHYKRYEPKAPEKKK